MPSAATTRVAVPALEDFISSWITTSDGKVPRAL